MFTISMAIAALVFVLVFLPFKNVRESTVVVTTSFGKYRRVLRPGFNMLTPLVERSFLEVSLQNQCTELAFQAITTDQANVYFKTMMLYSVLDGKEETIKNVAFKFHSKQDFSQTLVRSIEGTVRAFVATKRQEEVLLLCDEIVHEVNQKLYLTLSEWGYKLIDLQINEIRFDEAIVRSMAEVVASQNLLQAASNQGEATRIIKVKEAEAEREASQLRGQGTALFREEVARGISKAAKEIKEAGLDPSFVLFSMWLESMRYIAKEGKGNMLFFDGSVDGQKHTIKELMAMRIMPLEANEDAAKIEQFMK